MSVISGNTLTIRDTHQDALLTSYTSLNLIELPRLTIIRIKVCFGNLVNSAHRSLIYTVMHHFPKQKAYSPVDGSAASPEFSGVSLL